MATLLLKTEPGAYSFDDLLRDKRAVWDGITNPAALKHLRSARRGDRVFIYHTGDERAIVGLASVVTDPREDPGHPGRTGAGEIKTPVIEIAPVRRARTPVTLEAIKRDARFATFALVRQSRLSVMPVPPETDRALRRMAGL